MKSPESRPKQTSSPTHSNHPFFGEKSNTSFFHEEKSSSSPFFTASEAAIQAKSSVEHKHDEKPQNTTEQQPLQRMEEEEDTLQLKSTVQVEGNHGIEAEDPSAQDRPNRTGLPDNLKSGVEALSGISLNNVRVHYNSSQPVQLNALAYAQGNNIHIAPGQEQHLPHEAWHVVQQAEGRVQPTMQMGNGVAINDNKSLEHEADAMGSKALSMPSMPQNALQETVASNNAIQMVKPASKQAALVIAAQNTSDQKGRRLSAGMRFRGWHGGRELKAQLAAEGETVPANLTFEECDVNVKVGASRDGERLILGSDGRVWYTGRHYAQGSFELLT